MKKLYFNIHDKIQLTWKNPLWSIVPDFAVKYGYFQQAEFNENCITSIEINSGKPPEKILKTIKCSAERFGYGDDIIQSEHIHGRMRWTVWIKGLNSANVTVWYDFPFFRRFQWPWIMFPDHLIGLHIVEPVLEYKFSQLGIHILHSAALANHNGDGILISGRGGVGKTTYMMKLLRQGWKYLSDDLVLCSGHKLYAYPLCASFFDYFYRFEQDETIKSSSMIGALKHVRKRQPISFSVADSAEVKVINLLIASNSDQSKIIYDGKVGEDVVDRMLAVDKLERLNFTDIEELYGRFMIQLDQVFGSNVWESYWDSHKQNLATFKNLPCRIIEVGKQMDAGLLRLAACPL